jgi:hypothetical protein
MAILPKGYPAKSAAVVKYSRRPAPRGLKPPAHGFMRARAREVSLLRRHDARVLDSTS